MKKALNQQLTYSHPLRLRTVFFTSGNKCWPGLVKDLVGRASRKNFRVNSRTLASSLTQFMSEDELIPTVKEGRKCSVNRIIDSLADSYNPEMDINLFTVFSLAELSSLFNPENAESLDRMAMARERSANFQRFSDYLCASGWGCIFIANYAPAIKIGRNQYDSNAQYQLKGTSQGNIEKLRPHIGIFLDENVNPPACRTRVNGFSFCYPGIELPEVFSATADAFSAAFATSVKAFSFNEKQIPALPPAAAAIPIAAVDTSDQPLIPE
jgi:hypothetical protein